MIPIDKDIPPPKPGPGRPTTYPWHELAVGDSFLVTNKTGPDMASMCWQMSQRHPHLRFTIRTEREGIRIWRIEPTERPPRPVRTLARAKKRVLAGKSLNRMEKQALDGGQIE